MGDDGGAGAAGGPGRVTGTEPVPGVRERTRTLIHLRRPEEAVAAAREGLAHHPDDAELVLLLAMALHDAGRLDEALVTAERALALQPQSARALGVLGRVVAAEGDHRKAAELLAQAIALDPHDPMTHVVRGEVLIRMAAAMWRISRRDQVLSEAEAHAAEAVRLRPTLAEGYLVHAKARVVARDAAGAEEWARRALALEPISGPGHQMLGLAAQLRRDTKSAADHFVAAGKLDPRSDGPMKLLRRLRRGLSIGWVVLLIVPARIVIGIAGRAGGLMLGLVVLVAVVWFAVVRPRWSARRAMSHEARQVLRRDRRLRGRWSPFPRRPPST